MRYWGLAVLLANSSACYLGPLGGEEEATGSEATGSEASATEVTTSMGSGGPGSGNSEASGAVETGTRPAEDSTSDESSGSPDTGDSTSGEMSGCETGPLALPIPGCTPTPLPSTGDIHQDCVDRINQFRWECQCLPPLARWNAAEDCSDQQSSNDQNGGGPHANFGMCDENAQNTCPDWGSEQQIITGCLQAMWDEGPGEPFSAHGHYINMSSTDYSKVACGFSSSGGGVWSNQNFSP